MRHLFFPLLTLLCLFSFFSCSEDDAVDVNSENTNKTDSVCIVKDDTGTFDYIAIGTNGYSASLKTDSTFGVVCVIDSVVPGENTSIVAYADSTGKVYRIVVKEFILDLHYRDDKGIIDALLYDKERQSVERITDIPSPYAYRKKVAQGISQQTRAGDVLTPYSVGSVMGDIGLGVSGTLSDGAVSGLTSTLSAENTIAGGNTLSTSIIGGIGIGLSFLTGTGELALIIAGAKLALDLSNASINDMQNAIAKLWYENARPMSLSYITVGNMVYINCRVEGASMNTKLLFNVGIIVSDGIFITKKYSLMQHSAPYSGDHIYTFSFQLEPGKRYKYRAYLEPSMDLGWLSSLFDYCLYGTVHSCQVEDSAVEITDFRQTGSYYSKDAYQNDGRNYSYKYECSVTVKRNYEEAFDGEVKDWGYVYKDPYGNIKHISLKQFSSPYTDIRYAYFRNEPEATVILYEYIKLAGIGETLYGEEKEFKVAYNTLSCPDENHPHAIDLGLSSGTKWACCNVGASKPEDYGGYYAWGETSEKDSYIDDSSTNYNGMDLAGTSYDAATVNMGVPWRMPSLEQLCELEDNSTQQWISQNGVNGSLITGPNGGRIFLPAAGYRLGGELKRIGSKGYYWTSSRNPEYSISVYDMDFGSEDWDIGPVTNLGRGKSVRAVCP